MKKILSMIMVLCLLATGMAALAEQSVVICMGCTVNGKTSVSFEGSITLTAIADMADVAGWKVNGTIVEGEKNQWLIFDASGNTVVEAVYRDDEASEVIASEAAESKQPEIDRIVTVKTVGATLEKLSDAEGSSTELRFNGKAKFKVTADNPHSSNIAYWVINGVRYDFPVAVKAITVSELAGDMTIECVYRKSTSTTLSGTVGRGDNLIVSCENAKMRHIKGTASAKGDSFTEFDFSKDYINKATGAAEKAGKVTVRVSANFDRVDYWEFNEAHLTFSTNINSFFVRDLNAKMHYVPHAKQGQNSTPNDKPSAEAYYNVSCTNCTFSGGGYSGATSGRVKAGTQITVSASGLSKWRVNGAWRGRQIVVDGETLLDATKATSISLTINRNTDIYAHMIVN